MRPLWLIPVAALWLTGCSGPTHPALAGRYGHAETTSAESVQVTVDGQAVPLPGKRMINRTLGDLYIDSAEQVASGGYMVHDPQPGTYAVSINFGPRNGLLGSTFTPGFLAPGFKVDEVNRIEYAVFAKGQRWYKTLEGGEIASALTLANTDKLLVGTLEATLEPSTDNSADQRQPRKVKTSFNVPYPTP